jgi:hypothetical protein
MYLLCIFLVVSCQFLVVRFQFLGRGEGGQYCMKLDLRDERMGGKGLAGAFGCDGFIC